MTVKHLTVNDVTLLNMPSWTGGIRRKSGGLEAVLCLNCKSDPKEHLDTGECLFSPGTLYDTNSEVLATDSAPPASWLKGEE